MEQLNYRFLNYKHYSSFLSDLNDNKINGDSIVFIQDKPCIWARGKEYVCDGPNTADIQNDTFTFKNGKDQVIFSVSQKNGILTLIDGEGNSISSEYALKNLYDELIDILDTKFDNVDSAIQDINTNISNLSTNKQDKLIQGENIRIQNNTIDAIFDTSILDDYVTNIRHSQDLDAKQDVLTAGNGITISDNTISVDIDTNPILIVSELPNDPNPDKIYLLETTQGNDTVYIEHRYINGKWVEFGRKEITIDLTPYATKTEVNSTLNSYLSKAAAQESYYDKTQLYTKTEVNSKETSLQTALNSEIQRATSAESTISSNVSSEVERIDSAIEDLNSETTSLTSSISSINSDINDLNSDIDDLSSSLDSLSSEVEESIAEEYDRAVAAETNLDTRISTLQSNKQDNLTAGEGININNNVISVDDYISEGDINSKLQTLQQMLGQIYVLKTDVYKPNEHTWSNAPIYSFGDIPVSGGEQTPSNTNIYVLNQDAFNVLEQNHEVRNDVCYLITD